MTPFQLFIKQCSEEELSSLLTGELAISCNDKNYQLDNNGVLLNKLEITKKEIRTAIAEQQILDKLYQTHLYARPSLISRPCNCSNNRLPQNSVNIMAI